jgi:2-phosphosulfolactate phosphatase
MGYQEDIDYCFQVDAMPVLPYYADNRLVLYDEMQSAPSAARRRASGA